MMLRVRPVFFMLLVALVSTSDAATKPNVLFVYADDLGWGDLGCHGHPEIKTPHLDRLAAEGTDFHQFTVGSPVCSPSRVAIVTGHFPARYQVHQHFSTHAQNVARNMPDWLDPKSPLLPRLFKQAGYRTAHYGKWHLSGSPSKGAESPPKAAEYGYDDAAVYVGPDKHVFSGTSYGRLVQQSSAHDVTAACYLTTAAVDHTLKFIEAGGDTPFFINLWLHETHHLVAATDEDKEAYPNTPEPQRTYYSAVTRADKQLGRVLALLDKLGKRENTIVIFSSDNGPEVTHPNLGDKFYYSVGSTGGLRGRKRSLYLGGVGTPLLIRWPGQVPAGRVDKTSVLAGVDFFPTLLAAAGLKTPDGYDADGENVLAAWKGNSFKRSTPLFWQWRGNHGQEANWPLRGMREGMWVLLTDDFNRRIELFDLASDREQSENLAKENAVRVADMVKQIQAWEQTLPGEPAKLEPASKPAASPPKVDRDAIFDRKDRDKDGSLTLEEYLDRFPDQEEGRKRFPKFDRNGDGFLSRDEFVSPNR